MTILIVSGNMRSGTSMMMDALTAGGLNPCHKKSRDNSLGKHAGEGYHPNPNGFYELEASDFKEVGFPRKFEGQLIKVLYGGLYKMVPGDYKIVFMRRDQEESRQSYEAFFGQPAMGPLIQNNYNQIMDDCVGIMKQRRDVQIEQVFYRDVIENPLYKFDYLKNILGWPIDPVKAAAVVDPKLCRFKIEELTVGI